MEVKKYLFNKYFITGFLFVFYMLFFDQHSLKNHLRANSKIKEAEVYRDYYANIIETETKALEKLTHDPKEIERIAREKYYMKRKNEEVYIIKTLDAK